MSGRRPIHIDLRGYLLSPEFERLAGLTQRNRVIGQPLCQAVDGLRGEADGAGLYVDQLGASGPVDLYHLIGQSPVDLVFNNDGDLHLAGLPGARVAADGPAVDSVGFGNPVHGYDPFFSGEVMRNGEDAESGPGETSAPAERDVAGRKGGAV